MKQFKDLSPASQLTVLNLFCTARGYSATLPVTDPMAAPIPNPETKLQFLQRLMQEYPVGIAVAQRAQTAQQAIQPTDGDL
jgi:hypothetical protein